MSKGTPVAGKAAPVQEPTQRRYSKEVEFDTDLFRLKTAKMQKNRSLNKDHPDYYQVDHEHFYHTRDSNGAKLTTSSPIGGHFHVMELVEDPSGGLPSIKCSGPKKYGQVKGKRVIIAAGNEDNHTHEVAYEKSDRLKPRRSNLEASLYTDKESSVAKPIEGIIER